MPKRNRKVLHLCEKAKILHKERKKKRSYADAEMAKMYSVVCECELSSGAHLCVGCLVPSSSAALVSVKLWRLELVARNRLLRLSL